MHFFFRNFTSCLALSAISLGTAACGSIDKYNPFVEAKPAETYKPANATEYQCEGNKRFFVRSLEKEGAVWLIYPDREMRLEQGAGGSTYTNGIAVLSLQETGATLNDGPAISYNGCQAVGKSR